MKDKHQYAILAFQQYKQLEADGTEQPLATVDEVLAVAALAAEMALNDSRRNREFLATALIRSQQSAHPLPTSNHAETQSH